MYVFLKTPSAVPLMLPSAAARSATTVKPVLYQVRTDQYINKPDDLQFAEFHHPVEGTHSPVDWLYHCCRVLKAASALAAVTSLATTGEADVRDRSPAKATTVRLLRKDIIVQRMYKMQMNGMSE